MERKVGGKEGEGGLKRKRRGTGGKKNKMRIGQGGEEEQVKEKDEKEIKKEKKKEEEKGEKEEERCKRKSRMRQSETQSVWRDSMTGWTEQTRHSLASKSKASLRTQSELCALYIIIRH